jgi:outer membrane murein-binding lipoprotein Lpp
MDRDELRELVAKLAQQRDELEEKWDRLKGKLKAAGDEADEASEDVRAAASMLMEELKKGYARIRDRL